MNALDIAVLVLAVLGAVRGWMGGVIRSSLSLIAVLVAMWVAVQVSPGLGAMLRPISGMSQGGAGWLAFLVVLFIGMTVTSLIVSTISLVGKILPDSTLGALAGSLLGLYRGLLIGALLAHAVPAMRGAKWNPDPTTGWAAELARSVADPVIEQIVPPHPGVRGEVVQRNSTSRERATGDSLDEGDAVTQ